MAMDLRSMIGVGHEPAVIRAVAGRRIEAGRISRAAYAHEVVDIGTASLHLQQPIESSLLEPGKERRQLIQIWLLFGQPRIPGEYDEFIEVLPETINKSLCPG